MLYKISLLTSHIFTVLYPLCFLISVRDPLKHRFHTFHLGLPCVIAGVLLASIVIGDLPNLVKYGTVVWAAILFIISGYYWKKEYPNPYVLLIPVVLGLINFIQLQALYISSDWKIMMIGLLAGMVFTSSMYAMNLGHFYLNVHGLPIKHLVWATHAFLASLTLRLMWDIYLFFQTSVMYKGELISLMKFTMSLDGMFLFIGIFFGTLFPLVSLYFAYGTLKLRNTQATTGILYVILSAVLLGDLSYKYYLIRYGIPL